MDKELIYTAQITVEAVYGRGADTAPPGYRIVSFSPPEIGQEFYVPALGVELKVIGFETKK